MKIVSTFILVFLFVQLKGQESIKVNVEQRPSSRGIQTAFEVAVPQATPSEAIDLWKKAIVPKKLFKKSPKMRKEKDEWIANDVLIRDITDLPLNVITRVNSFTGNIYVQVFLQSEGGFIGSSGSSEQTTEAAIKFVRNYGVDLYRHAVGLELKSEENKLKSLENDQKHLERKNKSFNNKATEARKDKANKADEADYQRQVLGNNSRNPLGQIGDTSREDAEGRLKSAEKDLKKAGKAESRFNRKIKKNEKNQRDLEREIEQQKEKVEAVNLKLSNIR